MTTAGMDSTPDLTEVIRRALEEAALAGLCHEGRIEIAVQAVRQARPDMRVEEALELVEIEAAD
jgi:hypothetical protein